MELHTKLAPLMDRLQAQGSSSGSSVAAGNGNGTAAGAALAASTAQPQQQPPRPSPLSPSSPSSPPPQLLHRPSLATAEWGERDADLLWAGYSDVTQRLEKLTEAQAQLQSGMAQVQQRLRGLESRPVYVIDGQAPLKATGFLLFFLSVVNFVGLLARFQMGMFLPALWWGKNNAMLVAARQSLDVCIPLCNTAVVLIICVQAMRAAWRGLFA